MLGMDDELLELLKHHLSILANKEQIKGIILIPSKTWQARDTVAKLLGDFCQSPCIRQIVEVA